MELPNTKPIRDIQRRLNAMRSDQLGAILSEAARLRRSSDETDRMTGEALYLQVLSAFAYQAAIEAEPGDGLGVHRHSL